MRGTKRAMMIVIVLLHAIAAPGWAGWLVAWGWDDDGEVSNTPAGNDFTTVSAGFDHSVALKSDGSLVSWGDNSYGQVGRTPAGNDFVGIAAGGWHTVALKSDGSLVAWGGNDYGQVSDTPAGNGFLAVAADEYHNVALKSDGSLVAWGDTGSAPTGNDFTAVSAGLYHNVALRSDGSLLAWGNDQSGQVSDTPAGNDFVAVSAGNWHNVALKSDGSLVAWGSTSSAPTGNDFIAVAVGASHGLALKGDGSLLAWGNDQFGQVTETPVGNGFVAIAAGKHHNVAVRSIADAAPMITSTPTPAIIAGQAYSYNVDATGFPGPTYSLVKAPSGMSIDSTTGVITWVPSEAQLGATHVRVLATNPVSSDAQSFMVTVRWPGSLVAWGIEGSYDDNYGQVANTPSGDDFVAVAAGFYHNVALKSDGSLVAWGRDDEWDGQVSNTPSGNDFVAISAGLNYSFALKTDASLVAWGHDGSGDCDVPEGNNFMAVSAGAYNVALKSDGWLTAWGLYATRPTGNDFVAISAGGSQDAALRSDGSLIVWGSDYDGQVRNTPTGNDFVAVASGGEHNVALRSDGSLAAWGADDYRQVSDTPAGNDFVAVAAGYYHNVALRADGSLAAWGHDFWGQVSKTPAGNNFVAVSAGTYHSVAIAASANGEPDFGPDDSADFSGVPFLHAQSGEVRTYQGQAGYSGTGFTRSFSKDTLLDVNCLRIDETAVPAHDKESSSLWLAKDRDGRIWVFKVLLDGAELFAASSVDELISCDQGAVPMEIRLMTDNWDVGAKITDLTGSTTEVLSNTATLPQFPGKQFVLVKWTSDTGLDVDYEYHHESTGLILDVWDDSGDVDGDGWILSDFLAVRLHDWNGDGIISIVGDVPPFVNCVYFGNCPNGVDAIAVGDCNGDGIISIVGDVPCFVDCVYFGNCQD